MSPLPIIAVVGRPNVGKSTLFNRIVGRRAAVVDNLPGVTRDRNYRLSSWQGEEFLLVDTGGMVIDEKESLGHRINEQVRSAVREASAVLMVVDGTCGILHEDLHLAKLLRREASDKTLLIVNKAESSRIRYEIDACRTLGLGDPQPASALHGSGVADILDKAVDLCRKNSARKRGAQPAECVLRLAVVGRPNAGKSSFVNKVLGTDRMIVDDVPGTTRDAIDTTIIHGGRPFSLIDTAGLRKKSHVKQDLEYYFNLRSIHTIERSDVVVIMVDAQEGLGVQDLRIVRQVIAKRKGLILAWNKWDLVRKDHKTFDRLVKEVKQRYLELRFVPMLAVSALTGQRVRSILDRSVAVHERMKTRVPSAAFEDNVFSWIRETPHPAIPADPVRFLGARQVEADNPCFRFFTTNPKGVTPAYVRFLTNKIYETYDFEGCPLTLEFKSVARPGKSPSLKAPRRKRQ